MRRSPPCPPAGLQPTDAVPWGRPGPEKLDGHNLTVKSRDGQSLSITLAPDVDIITLVKKSLADIKPGDFVASTGIKDKDGKIHAIEARIFPKATPDGGRQFAWDLMPDSVMTNATVGTVTKAAQGAVLHVTFTGGEFRIQHRPGCADSGQRSRRYEPVEAWCGGVRHRLKETRRRRDRGTALCRKRRDQAADVTLPAPSSVTLGGAPEDLDLSKRNRDLGIARMNVRLPPAKTEEILPLLDRWAKLIRQLGA